MTAQRVTLQKPLYDRVPYPASMYAFERIKDMSHRKEVQLLMDVPKKVEKILAGSDEKIDALKSYEIMDRLPLELRDNPLHGRYHRLSEYTDPTWGRMLYSITGGFCRNELMGVDAKTDIDVIVQNDLQSLNALSMCFKALPSENTVVQVYQIEDNTMHTIPKTYVVNVKESAVDSIHAKHVFVDPLEFDFTMSCACISTSDGWLYASPATLHDIHNRILRATCQLGENYDPSMLLRLPLLIRSIRFALKYDMKIHNDLYMAMKAYFALQRDMHNSDELSMFHGLKHLYDDSADLRAEFFSIMKKFDVYGIESYSTFDDYFKYLDKQVKDGEAKKSRIFCPYQDSVTY